MRYFMLKLYHKIHLLFNIRFFFDLIFLIIIKCCIPLGLILNSLLIIILPHHTFLTIANILQIYYILNSLKVT
jgi:hypothetical protein